MKKTLLLLITVLIVFVGGFYIFDGYLCGHLYYGRSPFLTCSGGQGAGLNMLGSWNNWSVVLLAILGAAVPLLYLILSKKISLWRLILWFVVGSALYMIGYAMVKDSLLGAGFIILLFHIALLFTVLFFFILTVTVLGNRLFQVLKRGKSELDMHDVFLQFTVGIIAFCLGNIILILCDAYRGVVVRAEVAAAIYILMKQKEAVQKIIITAQHFFQVVHTTLSKLPWTRILYYTLVVATCMYIFMGLNLAYTPYPTAWDANHAYIFIPRAWALHNGIYWGSSGALQTPYLWNGFLTFWFKIAQSFPIGGTLFGVGPDTLSIVMNFWSGPLVLLASGFLLHAFLEYIQSKVTTLVSKQYTMIMLCVGWILMLLWLTSGMGAFLVFVDNKTDLAVMFFAVIALYVGIQFIRKVLAIQEHDTKHERQLGKQYAILAGLFFAAAALAKPTGMFDIVHFGILFLLQWHGALVAVGAYLMILGVLGKTGMLLVNQFISPSSATVLIAIGAVVGIAGMLPNVMRKVYRQYLRYFLYWVATMVVAFVVYKAPFIVIQQWLINKTINIQQVAHDILLSKNVQTNKPVLLASTFSPATLVDVSTDTTTKATCVQQKVDTGSLYVNLKPVSSDGSSEDLGRYIGYGWKSFSSFALLSFLPTGCYGIQSDVRALCSVAGQFDVSDMTNFQKALEAAPQSVQVKDWEAQLASATTDFDRSTIAKKVVTYIQNNTIWKTADAVYIPYIYLVPFNSTFNWSLQNLSSYYTDIGVIRLLGLCLVVVGLLYGILIRKKILTNISLITLGAWAIRWVAGSAIIWYSLSVIVWTIISMLAYIYFLYQEGKKQTLIQTLSLTIIAGCLIVWVIIQLLFNFIRIGSQGGEGGPFGWYKSNVGQKDIVDEKLQRDTQTTIGYSAHDVFNMQFPWYNKILKAINTRADGEGVVIAGTYSQYFIDNQRNVSSDGFLSEFRHTMSDNSVCNTYRRLQDKKVKYMVIDPNIASIVMGGGNNTLFNRFFGVSSDNTLSQYGTLTMLQALAQQGYVHLFMTNNLVTKYSFIIPDAQLQTVLGVSTGGNMILERAKMSAARYFPRAQEYANAAMQLFVQRIRTFDAIGDLADVLGKDIDSAKVTDLAKRIASGASKQDYTRTQQDMLALSNDDRTVLLQYLSLQQAMTQNPTQFRQYVISILSQSINNSSQVIVLTID